MRALAWVQGTLAILNLTIAGIWLYGLATGGCGGFPLFAGMATTFVAGVLAAGGLWSLVYHAARIGDSTPR